MDWRIVMQHRMAIQNMCCIFSSTEKWTSSMGQLFQRSATNFDGLKIWLPASDVSKRCAASFHRLTNEHLAWNGYPKDLLCLFRGLANGRPELDGYLNDLMYLFMDWRMDIQHRTASRKICCVFLGFSNGHPASKSYPKDLLYDFMDWRVVMQHQTAIQNMCCIFSSTDKWTTSMGRLFERSATYFCGMNNGHPASDG